MEGSVTSGGHAMRVSRRIFSTMFFAMHSERGIVVSDGDRRGSIVSGGIPHDT